MIDEIKVNFPVVLKAVGENLAHKSEVGGVRLDLKDQKELVDAFAIVTSDNRLFSAHGFLIQEMIAGGTEMIVGAKRDPQFGPVVMVGLGAFWLNSFPTSFLPSRPSILGWQDAWLNP